MAGWEMKADVKPPAGWSVWKMPEQTYAVVACTMATYGEAYRYVVQQALPMEGYVQAGATHEFYPGEFRDIEKDAFYVYVTIKKSISKTSLSRTAASRALYVEAYSTQSRNKNPAQPVTLLNISNLKDR